MTALELAERLRARRSGSRWLARCPAHDDHRPSLSIAEGAGGRVLLRCWAGCDTAAVLAALDLTWRGISGAPATPAERAQRRGERLQRELAEAAERRRRDSLAAAETQLSERAGRIASRLAALELAGVPPAYAGEAEALSADYGMTLGALRDLEAR